jgi:glycosyltransferase involved in cell wall biosynthesis
MPALELAPLAPADYRLSIVLPVYSETETVRRIVNWFRDNLGDMLAEIIIVVSPRSQTASQAICKELAASDDRIRVHEQENNPGLGHAVREGLALTTGNLVLMMDSDGEMEIETVARMFAEMAGGNHAAVFASRWSRGGGFSGYSKLKYCLNWGFQHIFRLLFWTPIRDLTYGFKLLRGELARGIRLDGTLHEIACETTLKPIRLGARVTQVPTRWTARTEGASKNTFWRNFRYVAMALRIRLCGVEWRTEQGVVTHGVSPGPSPQSAGEASRDFEDSAPAARHLE